MNEFMEEELQSEQIDGQSTTLKVFDDDDLEDEDDNGIFVGVSSVLGSRKSQQDTVFGQFENEIGIGIVCDGMGGLKGGERASALAVEALASAYFNQMPISDFASFYRKQAVMIDQMVAGLADEKGKLLGAGTTMVAATIRDGLLFYLSIGDSRIYLIRGNTIRPLNRLHNYRLTMDAKMRDGTMSELEYKRQQKKAEALISFIGMGNVSMMDINSEGLRLEHRDMILLCSDGLYKALKEDEIVNVLSRHAFDMKKAAEQLTAEATNRCTKKQDNTSVVLMQYRYSDL